MRTPLLFLVIAHSSFFTQANNEPKQCFAIRQTEHVKIDAKLDEAIWKNANPAGDFTMNRPIEGGKPSMRTEVKVAYDDQAIYIGAVMYDPSPDSILHEFGNRDDFNLNADYFRFVVDPYNLRQDAYDFGVFASGVQTDSRFSDPTFNAVWHSEVEINESGWTVEIKIPYSAIRFPDKPVQEWGVQFTRHIRRYREFDQWALTPSVAANGLEYWGTLRGIENIKPPIRLSFTPYLSGYAASSPVFTNGEEFSYAKSFNYKFGADVKYGIDNSFTLDMTLLPDFGQVQFDNKVKNLSFQEIIYDEYRLFFKEGTELFSKNNLFYTRRIGKTPSLFYSVPYLLNEGETLEENPSTVNLINAVKVSGRNNNGLGLGVFNALTDNTYAVAKDTLGNTRKILTEPLTNYNIVVADQQINANSSIWFINANTIRQNRYDDSNLTGTGFKFANKKNTYAIDGAFTLSQQFQDLDTIDHSFNTTLGSKYFIGARKTSGKIQYGISRTYIGNDYYQLDMGQFIVKNQEMTRVYISQSLFQPWKIFRDASNSISINYGRNPITKERNNFIVDMNLYSTLINFWGIWTGGGFNPGGFKDYNEPRVEGRYHNAIRTWWYYAGFNSDFRKKLAVEDCSFNVSNFIGKFVSEGYNFNLTLRYRVNDKLSFRLTNIYGYDPYNFGAIDWYSLPDTIVYGLRKLITFDNRVNARYIFKNNMSITLNARHYWSSGNYRHYLNLEKDGSVTDFSNYTTNHNFSYNVFNIDLIYSWQFAPGSIISIGYKNIIENQTQEIPKSLGNDLQQVFESPQTNSFSLRVLYFLDYLYLKKKNNNVG